MKTRTLFLSTIVLTLIGSFLTRQDRAIAQFKLDKNLFPIQYQGKQGCINKSGKLVLSPKFDSINCWYSEGKTIFELNRKSGFVNRSGDVVISPKFDEISLLGFQDGLALVKNNGRWGFINANGAFVIEPKFEYALEFQEGLAAASINGKWGFIDKSGVFIIKQQFAQASNFEDGLALVKIDKKWGVIDRNGRFVVTPKFDAIAPTGLGGRTVSFKRPVPVVVGAKWGLIDRKGDFIINPRFDDMFSLITDNLLAVKVGEKWGYIDIDKLGEFVIPPQFDQAISFFEELAAVKIGDKWGFINKSGQLVIEPKFDQAFGFSDGIGMVVVSNKWGLINKSEKFIAQPIFDWIAPLTSDLLMVRLGGKLGYLRENGEYILDPNSTELPRNSEVAKKDDVGKPIASKEFNVARTYQNSSELGEVQLGWNSKLDEIKSATNNDFGVPKLPKGGFLEDTIFVKNGQNSLCTVDIRGFWDKSVGCQTATYLDYIKLKYHVGAQNALVRDLENPSIISAENELYSQLKATNQASMTAFELSLKQSRSAIDAGNLDSGLFGFTVYSGKLLNTTALQTGTFFKKGVATGLTIAPDVILAVSNGVFSEIKKLKDVLGGAQEIEPLNELLLKMSEVIPEYYDAFKSNDSNKQFNAGVNLNLIIFDAIIEMEKHPKLAKLSALKDLIDDYNASKEIENLLKDESIDDEDKVFLQSSAMFSMLKKIGNLGQFIPGWSSWSDILKSGVTTLDGARENNLMMSLANKYEKLERAEKVNRQVLELQRQKYDDFSSRITDLLVRERPTLVRKRSDGAIETSIKGQILLGQ